MIKILGIFAFVLVYYCGINAEIERLRHGKATTKDARRNFSKKTFSGNYSFDAKPRAKLTTRFPEDVGSPLLKLTIKIDETLSNDLRPKVVLTRRTKNIKNRDEEKDQTEKKDSESNQPKKKKKPSHNPAKLHNNNTKQIDDDDSKNQKDKKANKENARSGKSNKRKTHREKDNENTEKSIHHGKGANITKESKNGNIIKTKKNEDIHKHSEKIKRDVGKSKDNIKITKAPAALRGNRLSQSSNKYTKRPRSTPKQSSKPVRVVYKTMHNSKDRLRLHKDGQKTRGVHRQGTGEEGEGGGEHGEGGGEHSEEGDHKGKGGGHGENDHGDKSHSKHKKHEKKYDIPSFLSPYALMAQMEELMKEFPHANATITKFARTIEYNDIILVSVSEKTTSERYSRAKDSKYIDDAPEKKIIFIVHGLTVMGMKSLKSLVQMSELKLLFSYYFKHLDKFDFFIMPMANPDGYSASGSLERPIWNKNMSPQSVCPGVFVDRNFDVAWNSTKDISSCSQIFPGATPFSEVESKAVRDVFHYYSHKIMAYIHVHAGTYNEKVFKGDAILYPRGYTETQSDDDKYIDLKGEIDEAMKNASFRVISVTVDTLANWYGVVSGSSVDYAAAVFGIPYALEFVMQIYDSESLMNDALTQIWSRLIDTTIVNMWKSLHHASEERKTH